VLRFRGNGAGDDCGAVLEAEHQMGRAGVDDFCRADVVRVCDAAGQPVTATAPEAKPATTPTAPAGAPRNIIWQIGEGKDATVILSRAPNGDVRFLNGYMTVVPMVFGSALCMIIFSLLTPPPSRQTIDKYFPKQAMAATPATVPSAAGQA